MIADLKIGDQINELLTSVKSVNVSPIKNGSIRTALILQDKSGVIASVLWAESNLKNGDVIKVSGTVNNYNDSLQLQINGYEQVPEDGITAEHLSILLPTSNIPKHVLVEEVDAMVKKIADPALQAFVRTLLADNKRFFAAAAGKTVHHDWLGGLAEHSLSVAKIVDRQRDLYPWIDFDTAIAGALLHDIGKIQELVLANASIEYGDSGKLHGHIFLGAHMVLAHASKNPLHEKILQDLVHIVLSHHGERDRGAPVTPLTPEAELVHHADTMDARMIAFKSLSDRDRNPGEWTAYNQILERSIRKIR